MNEYEFGYPKECTQCWSFSSKHIELRVKPYFEQGTDKYRVMLIGQDPTIYRDPDRVKRVLMLDEENGQLKRWLKDLFGNTNLNAVTLYATNLVKCSFDKPPYSSLKSTVNFLKPYFDKCQNYLIKELHNYQPQLVLAFGEPAHCIFKTILDNSEQFNSRMKDAFSGEFKKAILRGINFDYSPCLHIKTFRVAETYGDKVRKFKTNLTKQLR